MLYTRSYIICLRAKYALHEPKLLAQCRAQLNILHGHMAVHDV